MVDLEEVSNALPVAFAFVDEFAGVFQLFWRELEYRFASGFPEGRELQDRGWVVFRYPRVAVFHARILQ